jgi:hypothetical protein
MLLQSEGADRWWCRLLPVRGGRGVVVVRCLLTVYLMPCVLLWMMQYDDEAAAAVVNQ